MTTDIPTKPAESGRLPAPSERQPSGKAYKKENLGEAIAGPEGFPSNSHPEAFFKESLEGALRSAVAAERHEVAVDFGNPEDPAVFGYLRGSTEDQENTIYSQAEDLLNGCSREGYRLTRVFWDLESGRKSSDDRPGLAALKEAARAVKGTPARVDGVIVWHMNRFSRRIRLGLLDLWQLSDDECPVIFPRRRRGRLQVANMDDSSDIVDAVNALADAEDDWDEHVAKIQRGMRTLLRKGIHPTAHVGWMFWSLVPSQTLTRRGRAHREVVRNPTPPAPYTNVAQVLLAFPEFSTAQALARAMGRRTSDFLDELQLRWAVGDFRFGVALDDPELPSNPRPIAVTDETTFERVSSTARRIEDLGRQPGRLVNSEQALQARSPEHWVLRRDDIVVLCRKYLGLRRNGKPKHCSAILHLKVASSTIHPGKDVLECHNGHTRIWPPSDVVQDLACDRLPFCPACGTNEHVEIDVKGSRAKCTKFECKRCTLTSQAFGNLLPRPGQKHKPHRSGGVQTTFSSGTP